MAAALQGLSPSAAGLAARCAGRRFPFLQIGLPAILSVYFDVFSGCLQAFIFAMLTMLYVSSGFPADAYAKRQKGRKQAKHNA